MEVAMEKAKNDPTKLTFVLFAVYFAALVWIILFKMQFSFDTLPHFRALNLIPFSGAATRTNRPEMMMNVLIFMPFGLYLSMLKPIWPFWKKVLPMAGVSLLFEALQYVFAIGGTDITDFIVNTLGGIVGIGFYVVLSKKLKGNTAKVLNTLSLIGTICVILLGLLVSGAVTYRF
jgi:glycopeptide antibiotics resistance protein